MKKLIKSSVTAATESSDYMTYTRSGQRFGVHLYNDDPMSVKFQVTEIHPYDDAEYTWARCGYKGACYVEFIRNGKVIDGMQWHYYEEEDYEEEREYIDEMIDQTCAELRNYNRDVKPRMIHN